MHTAQADAGLTILMALLAMAYASAAGLYMRSQAVRRWLGLLALPLPHIGIMPILIVAALLRLPLMFTSFWYDETFSAGMIAMPFEDMLRATMADVHPPLPYSVLWIWSQVFGQSELALRLPSLALGVLAVWLVWRITSIVYSRAATMAAVLACVMPAMIYYSSEARGYMLLTVLVLIAVLGVLDRRPVLMLAAGLLPWTHAHGYLYMAVIIGVALLWRRWMMWAGIAGVLGVLWLPGMMAQAADVADGFWLTNRHYAGWLAWSVNMSFGPPQTAYTIIPAIVGWLAATVGAIVAVWHRRNQWPVLLLAGLIVGVPVITVIISAVWRPVLLDRALLPAMTLALVLWAVAMTRWPVVRGVVLICALIVGVGMLTPNAQRYDNRAYYQFCDGADYVYVTSTATAITARYYVDAPVYVYEASNDLNQRLPADVLKLFEATPQNWGELPAGDVCVVEYQNNYTRPDQINEARRAAMYPHRMYEAINKSTSERIELLRFYRVYR